MSSSIRDIRNERIRIRVSEKEKHAITKRAKRARVSSSEFIRNAAENSEVVVIDVKPIERCLNELRRQGVNLNRLTYLANTGKMADVDTETLEETLRSMREAYTTVTEFLISIRKEFERHHISLVSPDIDWDEGEEEPNDATASQSDTRPSLNSEKDAMRAAARELDNNRR